MDKNAVIAFFDRCAPGWDRQPPPERQVVETVLDRAGIRRGSRVLDVACGTGVLFPYYLQRAVHSVTGIDLSPEMARIAREKWQQEARIQVLCGDVEEFSFTEKFDAVMVYNAFPHFPQPRRLIARLADLVEEGGTLTVAHGASRAVIDEHHRGAAREVSVGLMAAEELQALFAPQLAVETVISDDRMYLVTGVKR